MIFLSCSGAGGVAGVNSWQYKAGGSNRPITAQSGFNQSAMMNNLLAQAMGGMGGANGVTWEDILRKTMAMQVFKYFQHIRFLCLLSKSKHEIAVTTPRAYST